MTTGDGSEIGRCPSSFTNYRCLSTGSCNVCGLISGYAEGCDITSITPVCDADSTTLVTEDSATSMRSCLCGTVNNRGKVIYCYGDLVPRQGELFAEGGEQNGKTSSKDLLAAQLGLWTFGIFAL